MIGFVWQFLTLATLCTRLCGHDKVLYIVISPGRESHQKGLQTMRTLRFFSLISTRRFLAAIMTMTAIVTLAFAVKVPAKPSAPTKAAFTITPLILPNGTSEPEISIGLDGTTGMVSLQWLFDPSNFGTDLWTGPFGSTPTFQGVIDAALQHPGKSIFGAGDADVDIGSSGRLHATTLIFLVNSNGNSQLGVSAVTCPSPAAGFS